MTGKSEPGLRDIFNIKAFLTKKKATKSNTFIYKLVESGMFASFIENQFLGGYEKQELIYFSNLMNKERTKINSTVITPFVPSKIIRVYPPNSQGIPPSSI